MKLDAYLQYAGIDLGDAASAVREALDASADEVIFVAGSVVDELANDGSDLDVYLVSERDLAARRVGPSIPVACGGAYLDVEAWHPAVILDALGAVDRCETADRAESVCIPPRTLSFLHRLHSGIPLQGGARLDQIRGSSSRGALARTLLRRAQVHIDSYHRDLAGMVAAGQWRTALMFTRELVGATADALLAGLGNTNPSPKWRLELLRATSQLPGRSWVGLLEEALFDLMVHREYPPTPSSSLVHDAVRLSNRVAMWGENVLALPLHGSEPALVVPPVGAPSADEDDSLLRLSPNLQFRPVAGGVRVNSILTETELLVNSGMCDLLLLFDGRTSRSAAVEMLASSTATDRAEVARRIRDTEAFLTSYGWFDDSRVASPVRGWGWV